MLNFRKYWFTLMNIKNLRRLLQKLQLQASGAIWHAVTTVTSTSTFDHLMTLQNHNRTLSQIYRLDKCITVAYQCVARDPAFSIFMYINVSIYWLVLIRFKRGTINKSFVQHWTAIYIHVMLRSTCTYPYMQEPTITWKSNIDIHTVFDLISSELEKNWATKICQ